jgi:hypothetical protein
VNTEDAAGTPPVTSGPTIVMPILVYSKRASQK